MTRWMLATEGPLLVVDVDVDALPETIESPDHRGAWINVRVGRELVGTFALPLRNGVIERERIAQGIIDACSGQLLRSWLARRLARPVIRPLAAEEVVGAEIDASDLIDDLPSISVVLCTRGRLEDAALCLEALRRCSYDAPWEVVVVDNAPETDDLARICAERFAEFKYVVEPRPGLDWARRQGHLEARHDVVAYVDDDVRVEPTWVDAIGRAFAGEPSVDAVVGVVVPLELATPAQITFERYGGFTGGQVDRRWWSADVRTGVPAARHHFGTGGWGTGANMAFRRSVFDEAGTFDPALDVGTLTNGGGDLEMLFRIVRSGRTVMREPTVLSRHRHRRSQDELVRQLANNGVGLAAVTYRIASRFPDERRDAVRAASTWFLRWHLRRFARSLVGRRDVPHRAIQGELVGALVGARRYRRSRAIAEAIASPAAIDDRITRYAGPVEPNSGVAHIVDLEHPCAGLVNLDCGTVHLEARLCGQPLGVVHLHPGGAALSAARMRSAIAEVMSDAIVEWHGGASSETFRAALERHLLKESRAAATDQSAGPIPVAVVIVAPSPDRLDHAMQQLRQQATSRQVSALVVGPYPRPSELPQDIAHVRVANTMTPSVLAAVLPRIEAPLIAWLDARLTVGPEWLEGLVGPLDDGRVAVVIGSINLPPPTTAGPPLPERLTPAWDATYRRRLSDVGAIGSLRNAAMRTDALRERGVLPLPERLAAPDGALIDGSAETLYRRLLRRGWHLVQATAAEALFEAGAAPVAAPGSLARTRIGAAALALREGPDRRAVTDLAAWRPLVISRDVRALPAATAIAELRGAVSGLQFLARRPNASHAWDAPTISSGARTRLGSRDLMAAARIARPRHTLPDIRQVAITFDDGPDPIATPAILDVLREHDIVATFFVVGRRAQEHPEIVRRIVAEGHALGSHTQTHPRLWTLGLADVLNEIAEGRRAVEDVVGQPVRLFRPPHGWIDPSVAIAIRRWDLEAWRWTIDAEDWLPARGAADIVASAAELEPGGVLLLHDGMESPVDARALDRTSTVTALPAILTMIERRGLEAAPLGRPLRWRQRALSGRVAIRETHLPSITVVVPTYQRRREVLRVVESIEESIAHAPALRRGLDVVVSVDGSTDGTSAAVSSRTWAMPVTVVEHANAGRGAARNRGIAAARGDVVLLIDDDQCVTAEGLLEHRTAHVAPGSGVLMGPVHFPTDWPVETELREWWSARYAELARLRIVDRFDLFSPANTSADARVWHEHPFDESFRGYGGEDYELGLRLIRAGVPIRYEPRAIAWHLHERGWADLIRDRRSEGSNYARIAVEGGVDPSFVRPRDDTWSVSLIRMSGVRSPRVLRGLASALTAAAIAERRLLGGDTLHGAAESLEHVAGIASYPGSDEMLARVLGAAGLPGNAER